MKNTIKKICIAALMILNLSTPVFAKENSLKTDGTNFGNTFSTSIHDIDELDTLPISETLSFEEMKAELQAQGVDIKEFVNQHYSNLQSLSPSSATSVRYSTFRMGYHYFINYILETLVTVGLEYSGSVTPDRIVSLTNARVNTDIGDHCRLVGQVYYELEAGNAFYVNTHGDLYLNATITVSAGVSVGVGGGATITIGASSQIGRIRFIDYDDRYYSSAMSA